MKDEMKTRQMASSFILHPSSFRWPNLASVLLGTLILVVWWQPPGDLDHTWQIRMGEQIVRTGQIHPPETFTYTIRGQHLPDFEWLYEVLLWYTWRFSGPAGIQFGQVL